MGYILRAGSNNPLTMKTTVIPDAVKSTAYTGEIIVAGGTLPYAFAITAGALPTGLAINAVTGAITGTPTTPGAFTPTIRCTDARGMVVTLAAASFTCREAATVATFLDDFNRANGFLGMNYLYPEHGGTGLFTVAANRMAYVSSGVSGLEGAVCIGASALPTTLSQFVKATLIATNVANRTGMGLYLAGEALTGAGGNMQGYFFHCFTGTINLFGLKPGGSGYALALAIGAPVANDVFEMQADLILAGNRVRLWQNAVLIADVTDTDAGRVGITGGGFPGFMGTGNAGGSQTWDNLECRETR